MTIQWNRRFAHRKVKPKKPLNRFYFRIIPEAIGMLTFPERFYPLIEVDNPAFSISSRLHFWRAYKPAGVLRLQIPATDPGFG